MNATTRSSAPSPAERRRHRMFVTRNTEYHFRDGVCLGVRDRNTGEWLPGHLALRRRLYGSVQFFISGGLAPHPGEPRIGESMMFADDGADLVTSPLVGIERPPRHLVRQYPRA